VHIVRVAIIAAHVTKNMLLAYVIVVNILCTHCRRFCLGDGDCGAL